MYAAIHGQPKTPRVSAGPASKARPISNPLPRREQHDPRSFLQSMRANAPRRGSHPEPQRRAEPLPSPDQTFRGLTVHHFDRAGLFAGARNRAMEEIASGPTLSSGAGAARTALRQARSDRP